MIWLYRTRVGPFDLNESRADSSQPEIELCSHLNSWRDELVAGAKLKATQLAREHPPKVYQHFQDRGFPSPGSDDFHSPAQPLRYIQLRIEPMIAFYRQRIPTYTRRNFLLKTAILLLGVTASILARYGQLRFVAMCAAAASAMMAWGEFSDTEAKIERYSGSITALNKLLSW